MRYVNLSIVLVFRLVSRKVKGRFPDYQSLLNANLMRSVEVDRMKRAEAQTPHEATWTPILWALKLLERARTDGKIQVSRIEKKKTCYSKRSEAEGRAELSESTFGGLAPLDQFPELWKGT